MKLVTADLLDFYYNHIGLFRNFKKNIVLCYNFPAQCPAQDAKPANTELPKTATSCAGPILGSKFVKEVKLTTFIGPGTSWFCPFYYTCFFSLVSCWEFEKVTECSSRFNDPLFDDFNSCLGFC
jgi:hypothetical protein